MKQFTITMKDGTQYTHAQHERWPEYVANCIADANYGNRVVVSSDGAWIAAVSEIAHVSQTQEVAA
ncbi:MAG: hypothetical protein CL583_01875 [Alteromonadaceae bacterium]|nr:hypothetical protein [Alteromonadaceae bacterium]